MTKGEIRFDQASSSSEVDDETLARSVGNALPWDPWRFTVLANLQQCPRNSGHVQLVKDHSCGRRFALKRMPVWWTGEDADDFARNHPHESELPWMDMGVTRYLNYSGFKYCVEYNGVFRDENEISFVMGYAQGGDLFSFVEASNLPDPGPELENTLRPIMVQFLTAVTGLHKLGLAHRDLSLENVLLATKKGLPINLIDFGMATTQRVKQSRSCGKASYMAPEVHQDEFYDVFKADAFACGVILYAMLLKDYPWMATKPGCCKCFEYVREHGFMTFLSKRRIAVGDEKKPVIEVLSPNFASLLDGLLCLRPEDRLVLYDESLSSGHSDCKSVWAHPWFHEPATLQNHLNSKKKGWIELPRLSKIRGF